jgi:SAM-dependent methyltransferase
MNDWREQWREANRAHWDERVPIHVSGEFYDVAGFKAGREPLRPFEISEVGDVGGKDLLHLQCHFGIDTLSWVRRGARAVGLDFSLPAIVQARKLAAELALEAEFVHSDVYNAPNALDGRVFDVLYTGLGAIYWLPDIPRWARVVSSLIRPGGFLYLSEFHPFSYVFGDKDLTVVDDYFHGEEPSMCGMSRGPTPTRKPRRSTTAPTSGTILWATW